MELMIGEVWERWKETGSGANRKEAEAGPAGWMGSREREKPLLLPFLMIVRLVLEGRAGQGRTSQKSGKEEA